MPALTLLVALSACDWVDSTGNQPVPTDTTVPDTVGSGQLLDGNQAVVSLNENTVNQITPSATLQRGASNATWSWVPTDANTATQFCEGTNGFNTALATNSLTEACTDSDDGTCALTITATDSDTVSGDQSFDIRVPSLSRPVALNYSINATTSTTGMTTESVTLCLIAINEAPVAQDDIYTVVKGSTLQVNATDSNALLSNDYDDIDASNQPLRVVTTPATLPQHAARIDIRENGGFLYTPSSEAPVPGNGSLIDSFNYSITDGVFQSTATVNVRIVNKNTAPKLVARLPDLVLRANRTLGNTDNRYDLSRYFSDADNDPLTFSVTPDSLPPSGSLQLTDAGQLIGRPTVRDGGSYNVTVSASDGALNANESFTLFIAVNDAEVEDFNTAIESNINDVNRAPAVTDISNRTFTDDFAYDVSVFFSDVDNDVLTFVATALPPDIQLTPDGLITGEVTDDNEGTHLIEITAEDPGGLSVSDRFRLTLN